MYNNKHIANHHDYVHVSLKLTKTKSEELMWQDPQEGSPWDLILKIVT
jgi:hypothetical protein